MNQNKRCQNSFVCFSNENGDFVFVRLQYDNMKPNNTKNCNQTQNNAKTAIGESD